MGKGLLSKMVVLCAWAVSTMLIISCTDVKKPAPAPSSSIKKKVGIVFGGGGAKAAAHVGVLKRLAELGIEADYVVGTSMGSVIGALYAAGYSEKELRRLVVEDHDLWIYSREKKGFDIGNGFKLTGVITRPHFQNHLQELLEKKGVHTYRDINKHIPFRCIATACDIGDFAEEVCHEGIVARDVTSSISFPGAYIFSNNKGKKLLDGGMMNNLPVDVVRDMGADVVIAIDLENDDSSELLDILKVSLLEIKHKDPLADYLSDHFFATRWFLERPDIAKRKANIALADIYIHPDLKDADGDNYKITDYDAKKLKDMIQIGYDACLEDSIQAKLADLK